jgi:hypothetical protein
MLSDSHFDDAIAAAVDLGDCEGQAAASWMFDGNTTDDTYRRILQGIEEGDPAVYDELPEADLSGQWADTITPRGVAELVASTIGVDVQRMSNDEIDRVADAYVDGFNDAVVREVERFAREHLNA